MCFGVHFDLFGYGDCEQGASRSGDKIGATHNGHSGQFLWPQFCHPKSEASIIARKAIPKLTEMDKLPVLNTSAGQVRRLGTVILEGGGGGLGADGPQPRAPRRDYR